MYPTLEQIENASRIQLAIWYRFLPSPGTSAIGRKDFESVMEEERLLMDRICKRFQDLGGMNPSISKTIGW